MSVAGAAVPRAGIRHVLVWVIVVVSVALNVCFVAGALWTRWHAPAPLTRQERLDEMAAALALDPQQRRAFAQYAQTMSGRMQEMRHAVQPLVHAAWTEVARPQPDEGKVMNLLDQAAQARRLYLNEITATTIAFLKNLTPAQRAKFVAAAHHGPPPWAPQFPHRQD